MKGYRGILKWMAGGLALFTVITMNAANREIDFAVENAAEQSIVKLNAAPRVKDVDTIAFIGLAGDGSDYSSTFRAALYNLKSRFKFYTRNEIEWGALTHEMELAVKRGDIMDKNSLQKFGDFKGVQAYLYGVIKEATVDSDGTAIFRVTLTLSRIETGEQIWEGNIVGQYKGKITRGTVPDSLVKAAQDAGGQVNEKLASDKNKLPKCNIFLLPILGKDADAVSDVIISQMVTAGDDHLSFYSNTTSVEPLAIKSIAADLDANSPTYTSAQLSAIMKKLEKMYNINPNAVGQGKYGAKTNAYLIARVINAVGDDKKGKMILDVKIRDFANNKILWSGTFDGAFCEAVPPPPPETSNTKVKKFFEGNSLLVTIAAGVMGFLLLLIAILMGIRFMTRAR